MLVGCLTIIFRNKLASVGISSKHDDERSQLDRNNTTAARFIIQTNLPSFTTRFEIGKEQTFVHVSSTSNASFSITEGHSASDAFVSNRSDLGRQKRKSNYHDLEARLLNHCKYHPPYLLFNDRQLYHTAQCNCEACNLIEVMEVQQTCFETQALWEVF